MSGVGFAVGFGVGWLGRLHWYVTEDARQLTATKYSALVLLRGGCA